MPDGSMDNSRNQDAVSGLAAIIQLKLKGVANSAIKLATAEMLTDKAVLPRPMWVMTLLKLPPGQAATKIMAASTLAGRSSANVASQVPTGKRMNWGIKPHKTARGALATRLKSSIRSSSDTENTMVASTKLKINCCEVMHFSLRKV
jgi:hypothetical protein